MGIYYIPITAANLIIKHSEAPIVAGHPAHILYIVVGICFSSYSSTVLGFSIERVTWSTGSRQGRFSPTSTMAMPQNSTM